MSNKFQCKDLTRDQRRQAAALVREALPFPYEGLHESVAVDLIAEEFVQEEGEVCDATAAISSEGKVLSIAAWYPSPEIRNRQQASLHHALASLSSGDAAIYLNQLRSMQPVPAVPETLYLARLATIAELRGTGLAGSIMTDFLAENHGQGWSLHVRPHNESAIGFYRRRGFIVLESPAAALSVMFRKSDDVDATRKR